MSNKPITDEEVEITALFPGLRTRPIGPGDDIVVSEQVLSDWIATRESVIRREAELAVRKELHAEIRAIHMAHDWNEMSTDTKEWLTDDFLKIQHLQKRLKLTAPKGVEGE